jgi:hypothetical protein
MQNSNVTYFARIVVQNQKTNLYLHTYKFFVCVFGFLDEGGRGFQKKPEKTAKESRE